MGNDRFIPDCRLSINGAPLPPAMRACVASVSVQNALAGSDRVELSLVNEQLRWLDHPLLKSDNELAVSLGYVPDPLRQMFVGKITGQTATFPSGGVPMVSIAAQDNRTLLQRGTKSRWFAIPAKSGNKAIPDMGVAGTISAENDLLPVFDPVGAAISVILGGVEAFSMTDDSGQSQKQIRKQMRQTDSEFLEALCKENGWEMIIEHEGPLGGRLLRFMSPLDHVAPDATLAYGRSLLEFSPRFTNVGQLASVTALIWISAIKTQVAVTVGWDWDRMSLKLEISKQYDATRKGSSDILLRKPTTPATAPRKILGELIPKLNQHLTGSGSTVGDPSIRAGGVLRIEGVGMQFGGLYRVTSATHSFDSGGYRTNFEVRKEIWFGVPATQPGAIPINIAG